MAKGFRPNRTWAFQIFTTFWRMSELPHFRCAHLPSLGLTLRIFLAGFHYLATRNATIMDWLEMQLSDSTTSFSFPQNERHGNERGAGGMVRSLVGSLVDGRLSLTTESGVLGGIRASYKRRLWCCYLAQGTVCGFLSGHFLSASGRWLAHGWKGRKGTRARRFSFWHLAAGTAREACGASRFLGRQRKGKGRKEQGHCDARTGR